MRRSGLSKVSGVGVWYLGAWLVASAFCTTGWAADTAALVRASSQYSAQYPAGHAVDGNLQETRWASRTFAGKPEWLQIDFGRPVDFSSLAIRWEAAYAAQYRLEVSADGNQWQTIYEQPAGRGGREQIKGLTAEGRFLRIVCLKPGPYKLFSIWEIELPPNTTATVSVPAASAEGVTESGRPAARASTNAMATRVFSPPDRASSSRGSFPGGRA